MDRQEIIKQIDSLRDELIKIEAKQTTLLETKAHCQSRWERLQHRKKEIHNKVTALKVKSSKEDL